MRLKKVNAIFAFILSLLLVAHLVTMSLLMLGVNGLYVLAKIGRATSLVAAIHAVLSIIALIRTKTKKGDNQYIKLNKETHLQRFSGIVIIILMIVHTKVFSLVIPPYLPPAYNYAKAITLENKIIVTIVEGLFFEMCTCHASISFPKMLISLGIPRNESQYNVMSLIWKIITIVAFVLSIVSLVIFVWR